MILEINFTLVLFSLSFLVFIYLINLTLYKPVGEIIEKRKNLIQGDFESSKMLTDEANHLLEDYKIKIKQARQESQGIIQGSIKEAQILRGQKIQALNTELQNEKEKAMKKLEEEKTQALKKLESEIKTLTNLITQKVLGSEKTLVGTH